MKKKNNAKDVIGDVIVLSSGEYKVYTIDGWVSCDNWHEKDAILDEIRDYELYVKKFTNEK